MLPAVKVFAVAVLLGGGAVGTCALAGGFGPGGNSSGNGETAQTSTPATNGQERAGDAAPNAAESLAATRGEDTLKSGAQDRDSSATLAGAEGKENESDTLSLGPSSTLEGDTTRDASNPISENEPVSKEGNTDTSSGRSGEVPQITTDSETGSKVEPGSRTQTEIKSENAAQGQHRGSEGDLAPAGELQETNGPVPQRTDNPPTSDDQTAQHNSQGKSDTENEANQVAQDQSDSANLGNTNENTINQNGGTKGGEESNTDH